MNAAQRNRHAALLKATGYEDAPALTVTSSDGDIPQGRELSFAWLAGTVMTGLTSVLLMGAALYVSFQGQDTFSTPFEALRLKTPQQQTESTSLLVKTDRVKPVTLTRSEREVVEASIRETVNGRDIIRKQPFVRIRATLATAGTALSSDIPTFDPVALLSANQPEQQDDAQVSTDIYGAEVEGEVAVKTEALPLDQMPTSAVTDEVAANFVRQTAEGAFYENGGDGSILSYASANQSLRDLGTVSTNGLSGIAENVTVVPKTRLAQDSTLGRTERILTIKEATPLEDVLTKNGFTPSMIAAITRTLRNVYPSTKLPQGAHLRILFGGEANSDSLIPYRMSIYVGDQHAATVARTDSGRYVLGLAPPAIEFPEEDTEEVNVGNLPTIYRSIWETGRKHDLDDNTIERIVSLYAYDLDLNKKITPGDSIEMLQTEPDDQGHQDLLYVGVTLGSTEREFFRFRTEDGVIDYYDPDGQTGKRFLTRRPVDGGGRLASRFGYRKHPIFGTYKLHTGVDLAAPYGTPIHAGGDGVIEKAQWVSGYGRFVMIRHNNGYETGYGHMSKIASGINPGTRVRQGQVIGYVGSTGYSTGNHLHYEIKVNGRFVDPLSVKLPRDKSLPASYGRQFKQTMAQIHDLMQRDPAPIAVADLQKGADAKAN